MLQIKICGLTSPADARGAVAAGADAIGLNFFPASSRYLAPESVGAIDVTGAQRVGVFVNADLETIQAAVALGQLSVIQLHGDEPPEFLSTLPTDCQVIRARRLDTRGLEAIVQDIAACTAAGRAPDAVLVDAHAPGQYGGTGKTARWDELVGWSERLDGVPLLLAGGLTPENVAEAILKVRPTGVDTASGVESAPGRKDQEKMHAFVAAAQAAFAQL